MVLSGPAEYSKKSCEGEDEQVQDCEKMAKGNEGTSWRNKGREEEGEAAQPDLGAWEEARTVYAWLRVESRERTGC